jgi:ribose transport system ATP-binding protein
MSDAIVIDKVSKAFGETLALNDCSFRAERGEIHAIVGENGSGKSTLAKIMSGVIFPDRGSVQILSRPPRSPVDARGLGVATIFQEILVADEASVLDNLFVGSDSYGFSTSSTSRRTAAQALLRRLTLTDVDLDARVGGLPLNLKQWVVIARALLTDPKILILDESSAALDLDATNRLHAEMLRLRSQGSCVVIVTHRIAELIKIADRATILRDGHVVGVLGKSEITEHNLLTMMTPPARTRNAASKEAVPAVRTLGEVVLRAKGLRARVDASPFDLELRQGEIVGVAGLDGQGQDNFVRRVAGIGVSLGGAIEARREDGWMSISGLEHADAAAISYVSGDRKREGIFPNLSVFENLGIALYKRQRGPVLGWLRMEPVHRAYESEVRRFSIKIGNPWNRITSLSGGNQQKVLIGRAFAKAPSVIVLNDPARGVDLGTKVDLYDELRRYAAGGGAVLYLSSEIEEFLDFADRVMVFHKGTVFSILEGNSEVTEERMLAAMFGHRGPVSFGEPHKGLQ